LLIVGQNIISVVVTAQDGVTKKTYTLTVNRAPSANAKLSALKASNGGLNPTFLPGTTSYTSSVGNAVTTMTVTPTTAEASATVTVNDIAVVSGSPSQSLPLAIGVNTITTIVTAQDGLTTKTYTLTVTRATGPLTSADPNTIASFSSIPADDGIIVHQGLSPNGDGANDVLTIDGIARYPDNKLSIMNRSGLLVFEAKGYDNISKAFDGHSNKNGSKQQPGTYFYSLEYKANGVIKRKTGFIVLKW
jgi:gliding motility-associated-like protein